MEVGGQKIGPVPHAPGQGGLGDFVRVELEPVRKEENDVAATHQRTAHGIAGPEQEAGLASRSSEMGEGGKVRSQSNLQNREAEGEQGLACAREEFLDGGGRKLAVIPTNIAPPTMSLITEITMMHVLANTAGEGCTGGQQGGWSQGRTRVGVEAP